MGGFEGGGAFLAGLASSMSGHYVDQQERKREEERRRRQTGLQLLGGLLNDDSLTPEAHNYVLEKIMMEAGMPKGDQSRIMPPIMSIVQLMNSMRGGQGEQASSAAPGRITPN